jgi:hypothetical protein
LREALPGHITEHRRTMLHRTCRSSIALQRTLAELAQPWKRRRDAQKAVVPRCPFLAGTVGSRARQQAVLHDRELAFLTAAFGGGAQVALSATSGRSPLKDVMSPTTAPKVQLT